MIQQEPTMKIIALTFLSLLLAACGGSSDESDQDQEKVFDPLIQSVDKAKSVEDTVMQQKEDMDEAMKKMEEGSDDPDKNQ
jgi:hypothetical protein